MNSFDIFMVEELSKAREVLEGHVDINGELYSDKINYLINCIYHPSDDIFKSPSSREMMDIINMAKRVEENKQNI